jgi:hypothetical protein
VAVDPFVTLACRTGHYPDLGEHSPVHVELAVTQVEHERGPHSGIGLGDVAAGERRIEIE